MNFDIKCNWYVALSLAQFNALHKHGQPKLNQSLGTGDKNLNLFFFNRGF